ncbi:MAG: ABC transporter substrate-binding protein [Treponema sp.]|nr:ABC transporter substrate-binding protein [Treponema sp.]
MLKKYKLLLFLAIFIIIVIAAAAFYMLFLKEKTETAIAADTEINFGYIAADQLHSPAVMVMKEKKLLEAAGFSVNWHEYLAGAYAMQDMVDGEIDFACCGIVPIMTTHAQEEKLAVIAGANQEGSSLAVNNSIVTVKGLDNALIATPGAGSIQDLLLTQIAVENNIRIRHMTMSVLDMPVFFQRGEIDGFIAWEPYPAGTIEQTGHMLISSHEIMQGHQCCVLVTTEKFLQSDPETVQKLLEVYDNAYRWFMANQDESITMIAKATGMPEVTIRNAIVTVNYPYPPYCNTGSMRPIAQTLIEIGRITAVKTEELDSFIESLYHPDMLGKVLGNL